MARPIWHGNISFGLVNIPVNLFTAEKPSEHMHFHLLDKNSNTRIHNQRVNEQGKVVAWENVQHAYEFEKGKYIVVDQKMLEKTAANYYETVEITEFVPADQIDPIYFEKPYFLLPGESGIKGYILLHDILQRTKKAGIANVVIKTREHVAAIMPKEDFLIMILLRYGNELHELSDFPDIKKIKENKITIKTRELELAEQLVKSMSVKWNPQEHIDNSKKMLIKLIKSDIKRGKAIIDKSKINKIKKSPKGATEDSEKIIDFMDLLKKSVANKELHKKPKNPGKSKIKK